MRPKICEIAAQIKVHLSRKDLHCKKLFSCTIALVSLLKQELSTTQLTLKMDRTLEVEILQISRDECGGFLRDNMESLHIILRLECLCGGIKTKRIRIFQTIRSRKLRIFEARSRSSDGEEGLWWQEVEAIYVRAGWDGCFDCSSVKVTFEDRSVYKLDCGDCPKVQIQFESV